MNCILNVSSIELLGKIKVYSIYRLSFLIWYWQNKVNYLFLFSRLCCEQSIHKLIPLKLFKSLLFNTTELNSDRLQVQIAGFSLPGGWGGGFRPPPPPPPPPHPPTISPPPPSPPTHTQKFYPLPLNANSPPLSLSNTGLANFGFNRCLIQYLQKVVFNLEKSSNGQNHS